MRFLRTILGMLPIVFGLAACNYPSKALIESAPLISNSFKDALGREINLFRNPKRIVSLSASLTEIIYAIGAQKALVAASHDSDYPAESRSVPKVITYPEFDLPTVVSYTPDLVLASTEIHDTRISGFFDKYKMNLYFQGYESLADIFSGIRVVGAMLGRENAASKLADSLEAKARAIATLTEGQIKYNTVILLGIEPITVVGSRSFLNDMLLKAGGKNAFGHLAGKYPTVTAEELIQAAPEYILLPTRNDKRYNELIAMYPEIHNLVPAAVQNHVFQLEPDIVVRPGPRIVEGLAYMARVLHSGLNLVDVMD